jgi:hypothetical protein
MLWCSLSNLVISIVASFLVYMAFPQLQGDNQHMLQYFQFFKQLDGKFSNIIYVICPIL